MSVLGNSLTHFSGAWVCLQPGLYSSSPNRRLVVPLMCKIFWEQLQHCSLSGRPTGSGTWVGLSENLIFKVIQDNVLFANNIVVSLGCSPNVLVSTIGIVKTYLQSGDSPNVQSNRVQSNWVQSKRRWSECEQSIRVQSSDGWGSFFSRGGAGRGRGGEYTVYTS